MGQDRARDRESYSRDRRDDRGGGRRGGGDYDNDMRIVLFEQRDKRNERGPDWSGNLEIDGVKYRVAVWETKSRNGDVFLAGQVTKDEGDDRGGRSDRGGSGRRDDGDRGRGSRDDRDDRGRGRDRDDRGRDDRRPSRSEDLDDEIPFK